MSRERTYSAGTHLSAGFYFPSYKHVMVKFHLPELELFTYFSNLDQDEQDYLFWKA